MLTVFTAQFCAETDSPMHDKRTKSKRFIAYIFLFLLYQNGNSAGLYYIKVYRRLSVNLYISLIADKDIHIILQQQ